jgi:hypothetical protein
MTFCDIVDVSILLPNYTAVWSLEFWEQASRIVRKFVVLSTYCLRNWRNFCSNRGRVHFMLISEPLHFSIVLFNFCKIYVPNTVVTTLKPFKWFHYDILNWEKLLHRIYSKETKVCDWMSFHTFVVSCKANNFFTGVKKWDIMMLQSSICQGDMFKGNA